VSVNLSITEEDAFHIIIGYLRSAKKSEYSDYGYDFYLPNIIRHYLLVDGQMNITKLRGRYACCLPRSMRQP
jgi:hypothetical protein